MSFNPTLADRLEYWNGFYSRQDTSVPQLPSQFSVFSAGEFIGVDAVVEFGCGNGRDSEFFALNGFQVLAFDASSEAIALCQQRTKSAKVQYLLSNAEGSTEHLQDFLQGKRRVAVYARFFLHAIDAEVEKAFFDMLENTLAPGSLVFLEYRTKEDESGAKRFGQHYRRYIDHEALIDTLQGTGFSIAYQIQGRGFAKYRDEDALVGRCVAVKG
ncbi:class I SAM-dependent methyltransferase [Pseudomonas sp. R151218B TE3479]